MGDENSKPNECRGPASLVESKRPPPAGERTFAAGVPAVVELAALATTRPGDHVMDTNWPSRLERRRRTPTQSSVHANPHTVPDDQPRAPDGSGTLMNPARGHSRPRPQAQRHAHRGRCCGNHAISYGRAQLRGPAFAAIRLEDNATEISRWPSLPGSEEDS